MMSHCTLSLCAAGILLMGCVANSGVSANGMAAQAGRPIGYLYHDGNHLNAVSQASPQAIYSATHGTWLWPPASAVMND
jgi:hypothetical protein